MPWLSHGNFTSKEAETMDATEQVGEAEGIVDEQAETGGDVVQFFGQPLSRLRRS